MAKKFVNKNPKLVLHEGEPLEECGVGDLNLNDLEDPLKLELERVKIKNLREVKRSSRSVPYVTYNEEELVYIPLVFTLYENSELGEVYHNGKEYYVEVLEHVNSMLAGTFVPEGDSLGPAIDHPDHGVECKIRYRLPTKLPVNFLKKFNYAVKVPIFNELNFETQGDDNSGHSRFRYNTSDTLNSRSNEADLAYEAAEEAYTAYVETLIGDEVDITEAAENSPEYKEYMNAKHIKDMGGLISCGADGAIFVRDTAKLKGDTLSAFGYKGGWGSPENYMSVYSWYVREPGVSIGNAYDFSWPLQFTTPRGADTPKTNVVNTATKYKNILTIPAIQVINLRGEDNFIGDTLAGYKGIAAFPTQSASTSSHMYPTGVIKMSMSPGSSTIEYAQTLLHELGHTATLSHTFSGGYLYNNYSPERIGDITLPFTGDAEPLNTLSEEDKLYIEGSLKYAKDVAEGLAQTPHEFETYVENDVIIRRLPTLTTLGIYTDDYLVDGLYGYHDLGFRRSVFEAAMFSGVTWGGSLSETLLTPEGNPQLVINKTTYTTHTEGVTGDVPITLSGSVNPDTSVGGYGYTPPNFGGPTFDVPLGVLNSCRITVSSPDTMTITFKDQNGVTIKGGTSLLFGDIYTIPLSAEELVGVTSIQAAITFSNTFFIHSIVFNTTEEVITIGTPAIDFAVRIPYCKLDEDGNQTDIYDDFWVTNGNWLKEEFPEYPPNTSTNEMHNIEYCPCLHAVQFYSPSEGVVSSVIPLEDSASLHTIYQESLSQYVGNEVSIAREGHFLGSLYTGLDYMSVDARQGTTVGSNNGYVPIFAFCGIHMQLRKHSLLGGIETLFDEEGNYLQDNPTSDRVMDTAPQNRGFATWDIKFPERQRFFSGSSDESSPYYNPYKLSGDVGDNSMAFTGVLTSSDYSIFSGIDVYGSPLTYTSLYECMQYYSSFTIRESDRIPDAVNLGELHFSPIGVHRSSYSPDQIAIVEACVAVGSGLFGKARLFGDLIGLSSGDVSEDLFTPIYEDIVEEVESEDLSSYIGCSNPAAVNYDPDAIIQSERPCVFPGEGCSLPTVEIPICEDSILNCSEVISNEDYLEYFEGEATESVVLSSEDYPVYEGCVGGGFKYVLDSSMCEYGTLSSGGCLFGEGAFQADVIEELISSGVEYTLNCGEGARSLPTEGKVSIFPDLYTLGGIYFSSKGEYYSGPYVYRSGGIVWAGIVGATLFRLYTSEQLRVIDTTISTTLIEAKKFTEMKENIENICKFVKL